MALASVAMSDAVGLGEMLDIVGYNYQESRYADDHAKYPRRVIFGSENSHAFDNWAVVRDNPYVAGQFLWTGIDYLGEARAFPNRANGAGLLDLAGFKKPAAWFRQSLWSSAPMVYLRVGARRRGRWSRAGAWRQARGALELAGRFHGHGLRLHERGGGRTVAQRPLARHEASCRSRGRSFELDRAVRAGRAEGGGDDGRQGSGGLCASHCRRRARASSWWRTSRPYSLTAG